MTRINLKNQPRLRLWDLLKRKKNTIAGFMSEHGITTYEGLKDRCHQIGVLPPEEDEFKAITPKAIVSSPQEGVIVLEPLPLPPVVLQTTKITDELNEPSIKHSNIELKAEEEILDDNAVAKPYDNVEPTEHPQKRSVKKKAE